MRLRSSEGWNVNVKSKPGRELGRPQRHLHVPVLAQVGSSANRLSITSRALAHARAGWSRTSRALDMFKPSGRQLPSPGTILQLNFPRSPS